VPTYVYHCGSCDSTFEVSQRMSDAPLSECECGEKGQVKRQLSAGAGIIFKGSGFYQTDYKNAPAPSASKSESKSDGKGESKSEAKAETKSESKPAESAAGNSTGGSCGSNCGCH